MRFQTKDVPNIFERLDIIKKEIEANERKLDIQKKFVDDSKAKTIQGEDLFQGTKLSLWKIDLNIVNELKQQKEPIHIQVNEMEKGGVFF